MPIETRWQPLIPFDDGHPRQISVEVQATVARPSEDQARLELHYQLRGTDAVLLPKPSASPQRRDELWQHTCLEAFLSPSDLDGYWEFNLAPSGHWNVYRLENYRQGLQPEPFYAHLPVEIRREGNSSQPHCLELRLSCPLPPGLSAARQLAVGLSSVIESADGQLSYWALTHPSPQADFHHRGGWLLRL
ncbi:MAG: DOMON-like domain-containing protein [Cyanobacteriota bacterium]|nr:DOMON-like domain-containing protein [Cyanobacteriota bacterium]